MTSEEFEKKLFHALRGVDRQMSTELYLRRLFRQIVINVEKNLTYNLLLETLTSAVYVKPVEFDPILNKMIQTCSHNNSTLSEDGMYSLNLLHNYIDNFIKMKGKELDNPYKSYGIDTPNGHRWYNFTVFAILDGFFSYCRDTSSLDDLNEDSLDWGIIGDIFYFGTKYE